MKLYELTDNYKNLMNMVDNDDVSIEDVIDTLDSIKDMIEVKVENTVKLMKSFEGEIEAFKLEEKRLNARRKTLENKLVGLKQYVYESLIKNDITNVNAGVFKVAIQKNGASSLNILDMSKIPKKYFEKQEPKILSKVILEDIKNGKKVNGVEAYQGNHLRIR